MIDGVEADDVIGTLAKRATAAGLKTLVSTGDKDLAQLVDAQVTLVNTMNRPPMSGAAANWNGAGEVLDVEGVKLKFGVPPDRIVDYLTLVGDTVDNVPGVDKVGPKTAAKWLAQYGSLDGSSRTPTRSRARSATTCDALSTGCRWAASSSPSRPTVRSSRCPTSRRRWCRATRTGMRCSSSSTATASRRG